MKKLTLLLIAGGKSGKVVKHVIDCDKDADYLKGFEDGLIQYYKENGDTVTVKCLYNG